MMAGWMRVGLALLASLSIALGGASSAAAAPSQVLTAYQVTCTGGPGPYGTPETLEQPWSRSFEVPDVSDRGPGAFVARIQLVDNRARSTFIERPSGTIEHSSEDGAWMAASVCVAVPNLLPVGEILITNVEGRGVGIFGYAYDPDSNRPVTVRLSIDGALRPQRFTADYRWIATPRWPAAANDRGVLVLADKLTPGKHQLCLIADDGVGGTTLDGTRAVTATLGCVQVVVK